MTSPSVCRRIATTCPLMFQRRVSTTVLHHTVEFLEIEVNPHENG